jgi:large subunit ribosomal protein L29
MKLWELKEMSSEQLAARLAELREELLRTRAEGAMGGAPANPGRIRALRKSIARILTLLREEELRKGK